jgi:hypothetical protein
MSFTVYGEYPSGSRSKFARDTAAGAVFKAADLMGDGWTGVHISDEKNKIYWSDRFDQLYVVSKPNRAAQSRRETTQLGEEDEFSQ